VFWPHPRPRVRKIKKHASFSHHRYCQRTGIPRANGFNGFLRALFGDRAFLSPSSAQCASIAANLTSASRRQDHTTSPSAITSSVLRHVGVHRIPQPNVRDDRETPLLIGCGMRATLRVIWGRAQRCAPAAHWHDGQITFALRKRVKCQANAASSVIPGRAKREPEIHSHD
jgi:hypothetical protein